MLLTFVGLALGLLSVVLPMTPWRISPLTAELLAVLAVLTLLVSTGLWVWQIRAQLTAPLTYAAEVLSWPETRATLRNASLLVAILIPVEWFQVRPWYQNLRSVQTTLRRYVLPRHLTDDQIATIANYLSAHDPQEIKLIVLQNYEEAGALRMDIQKALAGGGWKISTIDYSNNLPEGLSINFTQTIETRRVLPIRNIPRPTKFIKKAFDAPTFKSIKRAVEVELVF